jgi:HD-GYP domain-containing protein (c-di-GMP phosphodiesterase class II)
MHKTASLVYTHNGEQKTFYISEPVFRIGRSDDNALAIDNPYISRSHAEMFFAEGEYELHDLGSTSGTYVNGEKITRRALKDQDRIRLGRGMGVELVFQLQAATHSLASAAKSAGLMPVRVIAPEEARFLNTADLPATSELPHATIEWLRALYEFTSDALTVQTPKDLADKLALFLRCSLKSERSAVLLYDRERDRLDLLARLPASSKSSGPSRTVAERAFRENVAVLSLDASADERFSTQDSVRLQAIRSVMAAPIGSKTRVWGVCYVDQLNEERAFDDEELEFLTAVARQAGLILENFYLLQEQRLSLESFIRSLAASIDARDDDTAGHSARVAAYCSAIAQELKLDSSECRLIYYAGLLHDYGKIGIRDDVLLKPANLTDEEYQHIKQHPTHTYKILSKIRFPEELSKIPIVAAAHHERWDGTGYPYGMVGEEIPLGSRIVAVADAYDALVEDRVYSVAVEPERAIEEIRMRAGTYFDPQVVEAFTRYFNKRLKPRSRRKGAKSPGSQMSAEAQKPESAMAASD